jgi:hypothetical protein
MRRSFTNGIGFEVAQDVLGALRVYSQSSTPHPLRSNHTCAPESVRVIGLVFFLSHCCQHMGHSMTLSGPGLHLKQGQGTL